jgi:hypothetical protein
MMSPAKCAALIIKFCPSGIGGGLSISISTKFSEALARAGGLDARVGGALCSIVFEVNQPRSKAMLAVAF